MSNNYNILRNHKQPSSEDIAKHKDFDALLAKYQTTAQPNQKRQGAIVRRLAYVATAIAAAAASIVLIINFLNPQDLHKATQEEYFAQLPLVNPPIEQVKPTFTKQIVDVNAGGTFKTGKGARIVVPTQAFMNDRGELIEGEVNLHYRALSDHVDFFLAGVPMTYDSLGKHYQLESAGIIELFAEQNGAPVQIAPNKAIEVELVAEIYLPDGNEAPKFNIYKLDTTAREWVSQDVKNIQSIEDIANASQNINNNNPVNALRSEYASDLAAIETAAAERLRAIEVSVPAPAEPIKPTQSNSQRPSFELKFDDGSVIIEDDPNTPEDENEFLKQQYKGTLWQIAANTTYDERDFQIKWDVFHLRKLNNRDYEITATKGNRSIKWIVNPVLTGAPYQRALAQYEQDYAAWQQQMNARDAQLKEERDALQTDIKQQKAALRKQFETKLASLGVKTDDLLTKKRVINRFEINNLGLWACDRIIPAVEQQLQGKLEDQFGNEYEQQVAYLVNKKHNTIYRYYVSKNNPIRFDEQSDNLLWVVTSDNKIAVLKPTDFKKVASQKQKKTVKVNLLDQPIQKEEDARAVLSWQ
ncbi:MAG: hypothetical protein SFU99_22720 [Saprospiraceae bacterium]|nr:hypothetical protein [Saprospiraceae bacterium]